MSSAILTEGLSKSFGDFRAVDGVDLDVAEGTVLGLLGPNGAGKTTTVRILSTLLRPDGGRAEIHGVDVVRNPQRVRQLIGLTGQYASVDEGISGAENLYMIGRLLELSRRDARDRANQLLERFRLTEAAGRLAKTYSGGMRRRLDLAASLISEPAVLFLDEPTTGLDPRSRNELWDEVRACVRNGTTVLLTTQYMEEAEALADSVVVVDGGRVIASGSTAELRSRFGGQVLHVRPLNPTDLRRVADVLSLAGSSSADVDDADGSVTLAIGDPSALTRAVGALGQSELPIASVETRTPSLDETFLKLTEPATA
ncbi:ATP-binding cassette domain-containing protein [Streptomyces sp. NBC_00057]|uniref:ATP-binding cassette domain-containing protein n=1 Tax=Streptomyces sp. NBC_00057 TaxID=2975634 RepID=UPI00324BA3A6